MPILHYILLFFRNALDLLPTTVFPNFPPGGQIDDENNKKAIEALKNAKEYTIVDEEDALHQESILSKYINLSESKFASNPKWQDPRRT